MDKQIIITKDSIDKMILRCLSIAELYQIEQCEFVITLDATVKEIKRRKPKTKTKKKKAKKK